MTQISKDSREIRGRSFPESEPHPYNLRWAMKKFERKYLRNILVLAGWDISQAAGMLGITRETLRRKMKKYELQQEM